VVALAAGGGVAVRLVRPTLAAGIVVAALDALIGLASGLAPQVAATGALDAALRAMGIVAGLGLPALTVDLPALGLDLERRGLAHRLVHTIVRALAAPPSLAARFRQIASTQEARGLRIPRGPFGRLRAAGPVWLPTLVSGLTRYNEHTLALEGRAVAHPGRRTLLWAPADPPAERVLRWLLLVLALAAIVARFLGRLP